MTRGKRAQEDTCNDTHHLIAWQASTPCWPSSPRHTPHCHHPWLLFQRDVQDTPKLEASAADPLDSHRRHFPANKAVKHISNAHARDTRIRCDVNLTCTVHHNRSGMMCEKFQNKRLRGSIFTMSRVHTLRCNFGGRMKSFLEEKTAGEAAPTLTVKGETVSRPWH